MMPPLCVKCTDVEKKMFRGAVIDSDLGSIAGTLLQVWIGERKGSDELLLFEHELL